MPTALRAVTAEAPLRRALGAYALYGVVQVAAWMAIVLYAYEEGGPGLAGAAAVAQLLPAALITPALGGVSDRMSRSLALVITYAAVSVGCALTAVALMAGAPVWLVLATGSLTTVALSVVGPSHFAALPQLARRPEELVSANALSAASDGFSEFAGPVLAGVAVQVFGPWSVFVAACGCAAAASFLCMGLGLPAPTRSVAGDEDSGWRSAFAGVTVLWRDWGAMFLLLVFAVPFVVGGALDVLGVAFSNDVLGRGESSAGLIIGAAGIGGLIGAAAGGVFSVRRRLSPVVTAGGVVQGVAMASVAAFGGLPPVVVVLAISGFGGTVLMVSGRTLLQRSSDDRVLARVFAVQEAITLIGLSIGAAVAPPLVNWLSADNAFIPFGVGSALFVLVGWVAIRHLDDRAVFHDEEMALLRQVPFLAVLPPYELERLARNASWMDAPAGTEVITQGEPGDTFYVVATGEMSVAVDGVVRPHRLTTGQGFGEIALLRAEARTATVTALVDSRLMTISADDFLAAVTGSPDGHALAAEVSASHLLRDDEGRKVDR